jgi:hypothetical protein
MRAGLVLVAAGLIWAAPTVRAGGEIHGTIRTTAGETLMGPIRWDSNERFWDDRLDTTKPERSDPEQAADEDDGFRLRLFGWEIVNSEETTRVLHQFSIPFGHLQSIEPQGRSDALLRLKTGVSMRVHGSTTDLGRALDVTIVDAEKGEVDLGWRQIRMVEFSPGPVGDLERQRLYGTVATTGGEFTGFIVWDRDETLGDHVLDGEEAGEEREVPFREIERIEPVDSRSARVRLRSGREMILRGTNDVNDDNRGILVVTDELGTVEVDWRGLVGVTLLETPSSPSYERFDGGRRLKGTVHDTSGQSYSGQISWDLDETYSWETLDGKVEQVEYAIPFDRIRTIRMAAADAVEVVTVSGRTLRLTGSNDVNRRNSGVTVTSEDGSEVVLQRDSVARVEFD